MKIQIALLVSFIHGVMSDKGFWPRFVATADFKLRGIWEIKKGDKFHKQRNSNGKYYLESDPSVIASHTELNQGSYIQPYQMNLGEVIMLVITELAEAVEGFRKGDTTNFGEEIADAYIRVLNFIGGYELDVEKIQKLKDSANSEIEATNVSEQILELSDFALDIWRSRMDTDAVNDNTAFFLSALEDFATFHNIDLAAEIDAKMIKNQARPYKHGKKF